MKFAVIVPTLNPGDLWRCWLSAFSQQTQKPSEALVIDSGSSEEEIDDALDLGFRIIKIPKSEFNHGGTRQKAVDLLQGGCDVVVFLTQDAVLFDDVALERLITAFEDTKVSAAYGRQIPRTDAGAFGAHARCFNYGPESNLRDLSAVPVMGLKTCFISNSFAAYRVKDLLEIGGFQSDLILGEDACVAARLLLAHKKIAYVAEARVYHSHDYTALEEFRRYFDIGVFHSQLAWLIEQFGEATGEGKRFVFSELKYLAQKAPHLIPLAFLRTFMKLMGYRLGRLYERLPSSWLLTMSMHQGFWK
jgi:rhamnosyltransferase